MPLKEVGTRVLIIEDCRDGSPATGVTGIYEGEFPRRVLASIDGEVREYEYQAWMAWWEAQPEPRLQQWERGSPRPDEDYWFYTDNPRIRMDDGTVIWGDECWWQEADDTPDLDEAQAELALYKQVLRCVFTALQSLRDGS